MHHNTATAPTPPTSPAGSLILINLIQGIQVLGCYFPQRQAKAAFFQQCIQVAQKKPEVPFVMIGDFNTGRNDLDVEGTGTRFDCVDLFEALNKEAGLIDLWRTRHGDRQEWTWRSSSNGFRIDHAFGNKAFIDRFPAFRCEIDHAPRFSGLTDHSAVVVEADERKWEMLECGTYAAIKKWAGSFFELYRACANSARERSLAP